MDSSPFTNIAAVKRIIGETVSETLAPGVVISVLPRSVRVRMIGSNRTVEAKLLKGAEANAGDEVVLLRLHGQDKWVVIGATKSGNTTQEENSISENYLTIVAPPNNFRVYNGFGYILATWETPTQRTDISFRVEVADDTSETNSEFFIVSGATFIYEAAPHAEKQLRVQSIDELYNVSSWSDWVCGKSLPVYIETGTSATQPGAATVDDGTLFFDTDSNVLSVADGGAWVTISGSGANRSSAVVSFDYTTPSPLLIANAQTGEYAHAVRLIIDTPFDGSVMLEVGEIGATSRLMSATENDPYTQGSYMTYPDYQYTQNTDVQLYIQATGSTQGAGRVLLEKQEA